MQWRALLILLSLLLGAVINVAVAWGCAAFVDVVGDLSTTEIRTFTQVTGVGKMDRRRWDIEMYRSPGAMFIESWKARNAGSSTAVFPRDVCPKWTGLHEPTLERIETTQWQCIDARGWPMLALWCEYKMLPAPSGQKAEFPVSGAVEIGLKPWAIPGMAGLGPPRRVLPYRPIWTGIVLNSLIYAFAIWLLVVGPRALRRMSRRRRNLCPACAYPVGSSPVCTECGRLLKPPKASA